MKKTIKEIVDSNRSIEEILKEHDIKVSKTHDAFKIIVAIIACVIIILTVLYSPRMIPFWDFEIQDIAMLLLSLFVVTLFVERAVEVIITVWRDPEKSQYEKSIDILKSKLEERRKIKKDTTEISAGLKKLMHEHEHYRAITRTIAVPIAFAMGIVVSALGIRVLQPFLDNTIFKSMTDLQKLLFGGADVLVTGSVIGGGSKGVHEIIEAFINTVQLYRKNLDFKK